MTENPIENWLLSEARLKEHLERISNLGLSELDQAKTAFYELSDFYGLKKFPEDITEEEYEKYLETESINHFEKILRIHNDLEVNIESIDIVFNLLKKIEELQSELESAKNKLRLYEGAL